MKKILSFILLMLVLSSSVFADPTYELDLTGDLILGGSALSLFAVSQFLPPVTADPVPREAINSFDQSAMFPFHEELDKAGTYGAYAALLLPVVPVLWEPEGSERYITYGVMYAQAFLLTYGSKDLLKALIPRYRPYFYEGSIPPGEEEDVMNSFPSGHTAFGFLGATFFTATFCREFPDSPWKIPLVAGAYALAGSVAAARVLSGNHFLSDVLSGAALGALWGWAVPQLHLRKDPKDRVVSLFPFPGGVFLSFSLKPEDTLPTP
ncbi:MAG: phosphatase PAP2 family protein [Spirochaetales bacterium]|nr:phosphatase PAP2 family protein [Spirochaetales bacterium]